MNHKLTRIISLALIAAFLCQEITCDWGQFSNRNLRPRRELSPAYALRPVAAGEKMQGGFSDRHGETAFSFPWLREKIEPEAFFKKRFNGKGTIHVISLGEGKGRISSEYINILRTAGFQVEMIAIDLDINIALRAEEYGAKVIQLSAFPDIDNLGRAEIEDRLKKDPYLYLAGKPIGQFTDTLKAWADIVIAYGPIHDTWQSEAETLVKDDGVIVVATSLMKVLLFADTYTHSVAVRGEGWPSPTGYYSINKLVLLDRRDKIEKKNYQSHTSQSAELRVIESSI